MPRLTAIAVLVVAVSGACFAGEGCRKPEGLSLVASESAEPVAPEAISSIKPDMSFAQVVAHLGQPTRDIGSGLYIFEWRVTDGRVFRVTGASLCDKPLRAVFVHGAPSNTSLERSRDR